jgi:hypothetical protein
LTAKAAKNAKNKKFCAVADKGSSCQVAMSKLPPDWMYKKINAIRVSREPNKVYKKNLKAA